MNSDALPTDHDFWRSLPGMVLLFDHSGRLICESDPCREQLGLTRHGSDWLEHVDPADAGRVRDFMDNEDEFETDITCFTPAAQGHASRRQLRLCARHEPALQAWLAWLVDLSGHHRRCVEAREEQVFLRNFCDAVPVMMSFYDRNLVLQYANRAYAQQDAQVDRLQQGLHVSDVLGITGNLGAQLQHKVATENVAVDCRRSIRRPDGAPRWVDVSLVPINSSTGQFLGTAALALDVTRQHETQTALLESEARLNQFFGANAEGLVFHENGIVLDANPAACKLLGQSVSALLGTSLVERFDAVDRPAVRQLMLATDDRLLDAFLNSERQGTIPVELMARSLWRDGERLHAVVIRDMRDRQAAQARIHTLIEDLRSQKDRAEAADRGKSVFLAAASHDLRQPIHAMGLFLSALRAMAQAPAVRQGELAEICRRMQSSLDSLGQLLNMLLDVSRLDANAVQVQLEPTPLEPLFAELEQEFTDLAREKGLRLHAAPCTAWVRTDATVLRRILSNLVANAVRYTQHGRILLGARRRPGHIEIQVFDSGIGIAPEQLDAIFEEFYQVGQSRAARDEAHGLGLGLSIVQRSARLLDAPLTVRSTLGRGSAFSITLPACDPAPLRPGAEAPAAPQPGQRNVLVIDDDEQVLMGMQQLLQVWGHRVWCAPSADQAVLLAIEHAADIDLLLSDYRLGGNTTAVQAIAAVHACLGRTVPTFILTGDTSPQRIQEASELGFPLLHKPVDANALRGALAA
ncbi:PAS domain-containing hybrid sensor histidine kinase/response regulator [Hydrogenophaga sp. T2]|uniref:PAS domain-containing hybrid sensor histidine kinase/response regulator n=1 Tax=Hydrogenophaga sp. T2 TaxID=3132823 RepID=UPI003CE8E170